MSTGADSPAAAAFGADDGGAGSSMVDSPAPPTPGGGYDDTASRSGTKRDATDAPTPGGDDSAGGGARKKKKTGPGSRGVANLTPEQLAKKRANGMYSSFCSLFCFPCASPEWRSRQSYYLSKSMSCYLDPLLPFFPPTIFLIYHV